MSRGGKYYHYDAQGARTEISGDEYQKAVKTGKPGPEVGAKAQNKNSIGEKKQKSIKKEETLHARSLSYVLIEGRPPV